MLSVVWWGLPAGVLASNVMGMCDACTVVNLLSMVWWGLPAGVLASNVMGMCDACTVVYCAEVC